MAVPEHSHHRDPASVEEGREMRERAVAAVEERRWLEENYWRRGTLFSRGRKTG
jgi:hypothetical protein